MSRTTYTSGDTSGAFLSSVNRKIRDRQRCKAILSCSGLFAEASCALVFFGVACALSVFFALLAAAWPAAELSDDLLASAAGLSVALAFLLSFAAVDAR